MKIERLTPQEKFELVIGSYQTDNVAEYCRQNGIDRSYLYQLRREHQEGATSTWEARKPGRPPVERERDDAPERVKELERRCEALEEKLEDAQFESALTGLVFDELGRRGAFDDKRIKKNLPKQALDLVSEMRLRVSLARELDSQDG